MLIICLIFHIIIVQLNFENDYKANLLFTIFNTAIFGVYFSVLGFGNKGIRNKGLKVIVMLIIVVFFLTGAGFIDFQIQFNIPFLFDETYNTYSTASFISAYFMFYNLVLFTGIIVLSFFISSKSRGAD